MLLTVEVYSCRIRTRNGERCCKTDINKEYATPIHLAEHTRRKGLREVACQLAFQRSCVPAGNSCATDITANCWIL